MLKIRVADINIAIEPIDKDFFSRRFKEYICDFNKADLNIKLILTDKISLPTGEINILSDKTTELRINDNIKCRYIRDIDTKEIYSATYSNKTHSDIYIELLSSYSHPLFSLTDLEYTKTSFLLSNKLSYIGNNLLFHGSAIDYRGQGIIFTAPSGTGKSTHTSLWKKIFGDAVTIINDDKPIIKSLDESIFMYGSPWSGSTDINTNKKVPLKAIVVLRRGDENKIRRLSPNESIRYLMQETTRPIQEKDIIISIVDMIDQILTKIPIYFLECNTDTSAAITVKKELFGE